MSTEPEPVRRWLQALGSLCAPTMTKREVDVILSAYVPLIVTRFPAAAFTAPSLEEVGAQCKFFPAYGELCDRLGAWWRENRPRPVMIENSRLSMPARVTTPPTDEEKAAVSAAVAGLMRDLAAQRAARQLANPGAAIDDAPKARYLHPDHLAMLRAADPLMQRAREITEASR